jgi:hypothetical protein
MIQNVWLAQFALRGITHGNAPASANPLALGAALDAAFNDVVDPPVVAEEGRLSERQFPGSKAKAGTRQNRKN